MFKIMVIVVRDKYSNDGGAAATSQVITFATKEEALIAGDNLTKTRINGGAVLTIINLFN